MLLDGHLGDKRLEKKGHLIIERMTEKQSAIVNAFSSGWAESMGAYRFFKSDRVACADLITALEEHMSALARGRGHLLAIQDTTEVNYARHSNALSYTDDELGPVGNNRDIGLFVHPTLVVDADEGLPLGFSGVHLWNRSWEKADKHERNYRQLPIEEKESYRWIESSQKAKQVLSRAEHVTIIADREADIYEELALVPDERTDVLIRSSIERRLSGRDETLGRYMEQQQVVGAYALEVKGGGKRKRRIAQMEVRFAREEIARPLSIRKASSLPESVAVYVVEALERPETVPGGEAPIRWRLLTTHRVEALSDALIVIALYRKRWHIEELFRLLKSEGLRLEESQFETGKALKCLCVLSLHVACTVMQLVLGRERERARASVVFSSSALACLRDLQGGLEGRTQKQRCPYGEGSLGWASWVIGRLGGWKGYASSRPPGARTMKRGLDRFTSVFAGWQLAHQISEQTSTAGDVYIP